MDAILDLLLDLTGGSASVLLGIFVFLAAATLAFVVMAFLRVRGSVKRRAAGLIMGSAQKELKKQVEAVA